MAAAVRLARTPRRLPTGLPCPATVLDPVPRIPGLAQRHRPERRRTGLMDMPEPPT